MLIYSHNMYVTNEEQKKELIDYFYDVLIKLRPNLFLKILKGYVNLQGNSVTEDMICYFAKEIPQEEEDYFGNTGIGFCFFSPAVDKDCKVILSYEEFYDILQEKVQLYSTYHVEFKEEMLELLFQIKENLGIL